MAGFFKMNIGNEKGLNEFNNYEFDPRVAYRHCVKPDTKKIEIAPHLNRWIPFI